MSLIAHLFARHGRVAIAFALAVGVATPAFAQALNMQNTKAPAATAQAAQPQAPEEAKAPAPIVQHIVVRGTQRIEPATVLS
jgi:hypothetical protein